jgi:sulfatase-like protein
MFRSSSASAGSSARSSSGSDKRGSRRVRRGARAVHPLLFGAFPVLFLFRENVWGLTFSDVTMPLVATMGTLAVLQVALGRLTRRPRKVAVLLSVLTLLFFSYGHVWRITSDARGRLFGVDADIVLGGTAVLIVAVVSLAVVRSRRELSDLTRVLNVVSLAMLAVVVVPLSSELLQNRATASTAGPAVPKLETSGTAQRKPDIYYLVFDRYAGARTLEELFGYDNRELLDYLQSKGFDVADRARANYQATAPSLATSLNMRYLDWIPKTSGHTTSSLPMYAAIRDNQVVRNLRSRGYRYVHIGSRWDMTRSNPVANINIRNDQTTEFTRVFFGSTALLPAMRHGILGPSETDRPESARRITQRQLNEITEARTFAGPKFVFAHLGLPHPPYVFDRNGRPIDKQPLGVAPRARAYLEQLEYTNTRIKALVEKLLDAPPGRQPVVILQADEGPYPSFGHTAPAQWWRTTDAKLRTKFRILMAVHMPGIEAGVYPHLSPVNVFRVVFNSYFGTELPLLPDESYVPTDKDRPYVWTRITDRLDDPPGELRRAAYPPYVDALPEVRRSG